METNEPTQSGRDLMREISSIVNRYNSGLINSLVAIRGIDVLMIEFQRREWRREHQ